jgi:hypothetical protein
MPLQPEENFKLGHYRVSNSLSPTQSSARGFFLHCANNCWYLGRLIGEKMYTRNRRAICT